MNKAVKETENGRNDGSKETRVKEGNRERINK
jgi:hypothetical protein